MDCQKLYDNNEIAKGEEQSLRMKYPFIDELELKNCNLSLENKNLKDENKKLKEKVEELEEFNYSLEDERLNEIIELEAKVKGYREKNDELCYEIDEINRKWAEDNERNGDICSEQQEQLNKCEVAWKKECKESNRLGQLNLDKFNEIRKLQEKNKRLEEENKKLKEECGAMDIVEKLNKEFDDLQNLNQKLIEEIELKAETIKEQHEELQIVCRFSDYQRHSSNVITTAIWLKNNLDWLIEKGIITGDCSDFHTQVEELVEQDIDITDKLASKTYTIEDEFCDYVRENITSSYF